jgi:hypothetical protein
MPLQRRWRPIRWAPRSTPAHATSGRSSLGRYASPSRPRHRRLPTKSPSCDQNPNRENARRTLDVVIAGSPTRAWAQSSLPDPAARDDREMLRAASQRRGVWIVRRIHRMALRLLWPQNSGPRCPPWRSGSRIGWQQISQSSKYFCRFTEVSSTFDIVWPQYGHAKTYSIRPG